MKIDIYHGSDHIIEHPQFGEGKPYNDYGLGISEVLAMYYPLHEADLSKFAAAADDIIVRGKS